MDNYKQLSLTKLHSYIKDKRSIKVASNATKDEIVTALLQAPPIVESHDQIDFLWNDTIRVITSKRPSAVHQKEQSLAVGWITNHFLECAIAGFSHERAAIMSEWFLNTAAAKFPEHAYVYGYNSITNRFQIAISGPDVAMTWEISDKRIVK